MQHIHPTDEEFNENLGTFLVEHSSKAIEKHGFFSIAFSGGSAATKVCKSLEQAEKSNQISWSKWKVFFCDERYVELSHPDSNFKAINDGLLTKHPEMVAGENIFTLRMVDDVVNAAEDYENQLKSVFPNTPFPKFDLIVLGMGPDGHICSLFPNHHLLNEESKWVASIENSPKPPPQRITFTMNVVNNAFSVIFITTGEGKAENIKKAIEEGPSKDIPASLVKPVDGELHWFMDKGAASMLSKNS